MMKRSAIWLMLAVGCFCLGTDAFAVSLAASGIGGIAGQAKQSLTNIAYLITAGAYVGGMGFGVGAIAKFKAHKDNPTQVPISQPIALLFVAAALIFIPSVFKSTGGTLFGASGQAGGVSGVTRIS